MAARRAHRNLLALLACALVAVTLSLTWAPRVARADRSYDVSRVDIDATVDADGLLHVTETRTFDFDGSFNGVYWDIPVGHNASNGADVEVSDVSASVGGTPLEESGSGAAGTFEVSDQGAGIKRLKLFWPSSDESVSFTISYVASGVATRWQDTGELYWKFVSDGWDVSSDNVTCTLHLPVPSGESVAPGDNVRAWGHGPLDASVSFDGDDVAFSVPGVGTSEFAEMRVTFPAGWLSGLEETQGEELPDILSEEQAWADEANARRTAARVAVYGGTAAGVAVAVGTLAFAARNRLRYARDFRPRFTDPYFRDVPTADHPAVLGALANGGKAQAKELTATLMRLTDEGVVRLDKVTTRSRGAFGRERASEDYRLTQVGELGPAHGPAGSEAREIDARALEFLFGTVAGVGGDDGDAGGERDGDVAAPTLLFSRLEGFAKGQPQEYQDAYVAWAGRVEGIFLERFSGDGLGAYHKVATVASGITCFVLAALALPLLMALGSAPVPALVLTGLLLAAGATGLACGLTMRDVSHEAVEVRARLDSLRRWLTEFTRLEEAVPSDVVLWNRLLVMAVVLGVADKVVDQLRVAMPEMLEDRRLMPTYAWWALSDRLGAAHEVSAAALAGSGDSSVGGGGGGFSGGGGGGFGGDGGGGAF